MSYKNERLIEFNRFLNGKKVAIIGLGVSNLPLLEYMYDKKANGTIFDEKDEEKANQEALTKVKEYRFFDSYLIKQGEKIINISMIDKNIQKEVDVFLKEKRQIEPKNLKIFIDKVGYIYEKINFK